MASTWNQLINLGSGGQANSAATPILDSIGLLYLNGTRDSGYYDFVVPGDATDNSSTFRFKMPYDGWVLGFSVYGSLSPEQSLGFYVTRKDDYGNYTDEIHVDPSQVPASDLSQGYTYYADNPPVYRAGELIALKINNSQQATFDISGFIHVQYAPDSVHALAQIQTATSVPDEPEAVQ